MKKIWSVISWNREAFEVLNLPAIAQSNASYELGPGGVYERRKGELLHPSHEPAEVLRELKKNMGSYAFSRSTSNCPSPRRSTIDVRAFERYQPLSREPGDRILISWDIALSESETGTIPWASCCCAEMKLFMFLTSFAANSRLINSSANHRIKAKLRVLDTAHRGLADQPRPHSVVAGIRDERRYGSTRPRQALAGDFPERPVRRGIGVFSGKSSLA